MRVTGYSGSTQLYLAGAFGICMVLMLVATCIYDICPVPICEIRRDQILRLKQVDHIKSEVKLLTQIHHPFVVNL